MWSQKDKLNNTADDWLSIAYQTYEYNLLSDIIFDTNIYDFIIVNWIASCGSWIIDRDPVCEEKEAIDESKTTNEKLEIINLL